MSRFIAFMSLALLASLSWAEGLVISTQPIYLIAKEVTKGVETPTLLLADQTGHDVSLTPQHRKMIQDASLVIWLGQAHEAPLEKLLGSDPKAIALLDSSLLKLLPQRSTRGEALKDTLDTHVWLDPNNAVRIAFFIAVLRAQQFPEHQAAYWRNAQRFAQELFIHAQRYQRVPQDNAYWAYHDAYQYLERPLNLHFAGALTNDPHVAPTVAQIKYLNDSRPFKRMCLLAEGHASKNQYQKLGSIVFEKVDETMGHADNFVQAWRQLADKTQNCVLSARK
jgi:zinc transport system substrate-binding protein